jgi:hypothetical protein
VSRAREAFVTPRENQPGDSRPTAIDHADGQGPPPKSGLEFLWRVITDERALGNLCRLMLNVSVNLLGFCIAAAASMVVTPTQTRMRKRPGSAVEAHAPAAVDAIPASAQ